MTVLAEKDEAKEWGEEEKSVVWLQRKSAPFSLPLPSFVSFYRSPAAPRFFRSKTCSASGSAQPS